MSKPEKIQTVLNTPNGDFEFVGYFSSDCDDENILALIKRPILVPTLVRVQSVCYSGEIFESSDCDCHGQLAKSLALIAREGGVFIYMLRDGRGAGLKAKLHALAMWNERAIDTADAYERMGIDKDPRRYEKVCYVLRDIGVTSVRLLTNNPRKVAGLEAGAFVVSREALEVPVATDSDAVEYLRTKAAKLGHWLTQFGQDR
jgi:GTP cyclohydrolase II